MPTCANCVSAIWGGQEFRCDGYITLEEGGPSEPRRGQFITLQCRPRYWDALRGQIWLGGEVFRARMEALLQGKPLTQVPVQQTRPTRPTGGQTGGGAGLRCHAAGDT
jgi:hypothetical protein